MIAEAQEVLDELGDQWLLGALDAYIAQDHIADGDLDAGAAASASSVERLRSVGEQWLIFEGLNMLAAIGEWRGDLDGAARRRSGSSSSRPSAPVWATTSPSRRCGSPWSVPGRATTNAPRSCSSSWPATRSGR